MFLMTYILDLSLRVVGDLAMLVVHSGDTKGCGAVRYANRLSWPLADFRRACKRLPWDNSTQHMEDSVS